MPQDFGATDSHISIAMPDGTTFRAYIPFEVYSTDDSGEIVRLDFANFVRLGVMVAADRQQQKTLTTLPHSPERTVMRSIDL